MPIARSSYLRGHCVADATAFIAKEALSHLPTSFVKLCESYVEHVCDLMMDGIVKLAASSNRKNRYRLNQLTKRCQGAHTRKSKGRTYGMGFMILCNRVAKLTSKEDEGTFRGYGGRLSNRSRRRLI